jgi:hypothetical protein
MIGNIFTAAGSGSNAGIVGVGGIRDGLQIALASNGDYYYVSFDLRGLGAILEGNVFQEGGHVTSGDEMNALGPTGANYLYAVARNGDMFRKSVTGSCPCGWIYAGNVPGGATPSHVRSWGSIKSAYR